MLGLFRSTVFLFREDFDMSAFRTARRGSALIVTAAAACVVLVGCGSGGPATAKTGSTSGAGSSAATGAASTGSSSSGDAAAVGKLTGNFCTDLKSMSTNLRMPADAQGSLSAMQANGGKYLLDAAAYLNALGNEAPGNVGAELHTIASAYQGLAGNLSSGNMSSLAQMEQQMTALTTTGSSGAAFRTLITYIVTKCG
jgi:hypothetical protein